MLCYSAVSITTIPPRIVRKSVCTGLPMSDDSFPFRFTQINIRMEMEIQLIPPSLFLQTAVSSPTATLPGQDANKSFAICLEPG